LQRLPDTLPNRRRDLGLRCLQDLAVLLAVEVEALHFQAVS